MMPPRALRSIPTHGNLSSTRCPASVGNIPMRKCSLPQQDGNPILSWGNPQITLPCAGSQLHLNPPALTRPLLLTFGISPCRYLQEEMSHIRAVTASWIPHSSHKPSPFLTVQKVAADRRRMTVTNATAVTAEACWLLGSGDRLEAWGQRAWG